MMKHPELSQYSGLPIAFVDVSPAYHDIDSMEIVWHGNYMKYFEIARCAVLKFIDYDYPQMKSSGYAWPVVDIRSRFILPIRYGDELKVAAIIVEWDLRLLIKYLVINKNTQRVVTRGQSVQVPFDMRTMSMTFGCPDFLRQKIESCKTPQSG